MSQTFLVIVFLQKQFEDAKLSAVTEVVSLTPAPTTQAAGPPCDSAVSSMAYKYLVFEQQLEVNKCYHSHLHFRRSKTGEREMTETI